MCCAWRSILQGSVRRRNTAEDVGGTVNAHPDIVITCVSWCHIQGTGTQIMGLHFLIDSCILRVTQRYAIRIERCCHYWGEGAFFSVAFIPCKVGQVEQNSWLESVFLNKASMIKAFCSSSVLGGNGISIKTLVFPAMKTQEPLAEDRS